MAGKDKEIDGKDDPKKRAARESAEADEKAAQADTAAAGAESAITRVLDAVKRLAAKGIAYVPTLPGAASKGDVKGNLDRLASAETEVSGAEGKELQVTVGEGVEKVVETAVALNTGRGEGILGTLTPLAFALGKDKSQEPEQGLG